MDTQVGDRSDIDTSKDVKADQGTKKKATKEDLRKKIRSQSDLDTQVGDRSDIDKSYVKGDPELADLADPDTHHKKLPIAKDAKDRKLQEELKEKVEYTKAVKESQKKATKEDLRKKIRSQSDLDTQVGDRSDIDKSYVKGDPELADLADPDTHHKKLPIAKDAKDRKLQEELKEKVEYTKAVKESQKKATKEDLRKKIRSQSDLDTQVGDRSDIDKSYVKADQGTKKKATKEDLRKKIRSQSDLDTQVGDRSDIDTSKDVKADQGTKKNDIVHSKVESPYDKLRKKYKDLAGSMDINSEEFKALRDQYADEVHALNKKNKPSIDTDINGRKTRTPMNVDVDIPGKKKSILKDAMDVIDITEVAETAFQAFQKGTEAGGKAIDANRDLNSSDLADIVIHLLPGVQENEASSAALKERRLNELSDSPEISKLKKKRHALRNKKREEGDPNWKTATLDSYDEYLLAQAEKKKQHALEKSLQRQERNMRIKELRSKLYSTNDLTFDERMELAGLEGEQVKDGAEDVKNMALDKFQSYVDKMQKKRQKEGRDKDEFIRDGIPMFLEMMRDGFNLINPASQIGTPVAEGFSEMSTWDERQAFASSKDDWIKKVNLEAMKVDKNTRRYVDRLNQLLSSKHICDKNIQNQIEVLLNQLRNNSEKLYNLNKFADKILTGIDSGKLKRLRNLRRSMPDVKSLKQWEEQLIKEKCKPDDVITSSDDNTGNVIAFSDDNAGYIISPPDKQESQKSDNTGPLQIIYRIEGNGLVPHYGGGSYQPSGHRDILMTLKEPATKKNIQSILNKIRDKYNGDICKMQVGAFPSGSVPPSIWKEFHVRVLRGPASDLSNVKLENRWKSKGDGPSLWELKKGKGCK